MRSTEFDAHPIGWMIKGWLYYLEVVPRGCKLPTGRERTRGWIPKCVGQKEEGRKEGRGKEIQKGRINRTNSEVYANTSKYVRRMHVVFVRTEMVQ